MVELSLTASVGTKGQVVIPKPVRELLELKPRSKIFFTIKHGLVVIEKKSGEDVLNEFLDTGGQRIRFPKKVDWDELYGAQF